MISFERPTVSTNGRPGDDDLDRLLRGFFLSEVPHPWPEFRPPQGNLRTVSSTPAARSRGLFHCRFALALSIATLVVGMFFFPKTSFSEKKGDGVRNATVLGDPSANKTANDTIIREAITLEGDGASFQVIIDPAPGK